MEACKRHAVRRISMCVVPIIIALVLTFIFRGYMSSVDKIFFDEIVKVVIDLEGTLLGFIITVVSILVAFNGSNLTEEVKKTGHFKTVLLMYLITCLELFISIVYCVWMLIANVYSFLIGIVFMLLLVTAAIYVILCLVYLSLVVYTLFR